MFSSLLSLDSLFVFVRARYMRNARVIPPIPQCSRRFQSLTECVAQRHSVNTKWNDAFSKSYHALCEIQIYSWYFVTIFCAEKSNFNYWSGASIAWTIAEEFVLLPEYWFRNTLWHLAQLTCDTNSELPILFSRHTQFAFARRKIFLHQISVINLFLKTFIIAVVATIPLSRLVSLHPELQCIFMTHGNSYLARSLRLYRTYLYNSAQQIKWTKQFWKFECKTDLLTASLFIFQEPCCEKWWPVRCCWLQHRLRMLNRNLPVNRHWSGQPICRSTVQSKRSTRFCLFNSMTWASDK